MKKINQRKGFTFIEVLVVIAVIAVISVGVIYFLNPSQLQKQGRDTNRVSDVTSLNQNLALYHEVKPGSSLGTSSIVYISIPDPKATSTAGTDCSTMSLPTLSNGATYHCAASSTYRKTDGTGWIPINFGSVPGVSLATLPVDPVNSAMSNEFYAYVTNGTQYEILSNPEAQKTINSSASSSYIQGNNLSLQSAFPGGVSGQYIYVADTWDSRIEKFDLNGNFVTSFGLQPAELSDPLGLVINPTNGNIYIDDDGWEAVFEYDNNGNFLTTFGDGGNPVIGPNIAIGSTGNIYASFFDMTSSTMKIYSSTGTPLFSFGSLGSGNGQFGHIANQGEDISSIAVDSGDNVYAIDSANERVEKFSSSGTYLAQFGSQGSGNGQFSSASSSIAGSISVNGNYIYVTDPGNYRVEKFSSSGTYLAQFGSQGSGNGQFTSLVDAKVYFDASGNIYILDNGSRVEEFSSAGTYISQFGSAGSGNGQFTNAMALAFDASGNIYVLDHNNSRVEKFSPTGTYISQFGSSGSGNGQFSGPRDIEIH